MYGYAHESDEIGGSPKNFGGAKFDMSKLYQFMIENRGSNDYYKHKNKAHESSESDLSDDDEQILPKKGGFSYNAPLFSMGHEAPHVIQQNQGAAKKPLIWEEGDEPLIQPKPKATSPGKLIQEDDAPLIAPAKPKGPTSREDLFPPTDGQQLSYTNARGKRIDYESGKIFKDAMNPPSSGGKAPAKEKRGFGDHLKSFGKGLGSFGAWAGSLFGLLPAIGGLWAKWRQGVNTDEVGRLEQSIERHKKKGDESPETLAAIQKDSTKLVKARQAADMHALKKNSRLKFASGYQWRKRLGLLSKSEKQDIYNQATADGNYGWRNPEFADDEEERAKPEATWRDARDVLQGRHRNADSGPARPDSESGDEAEGLQQPAPIQDGGGQVVRQQPAHDSIEDDEDEPVQDDNAWEQQMRFMIAQSEKADEAEKAKLASLSHASKGVTTRAGALRMSRQLSKQRESMRQNSRRTSRQVMFGKLGTTKAQPKAELKSKPIAPMDAIVEENEDE